jgi:hypothetical protein
MEIELNIRLCVPCFRETWRMFIGTYVKYTCVSEKPVQYLDIRFCDLLYDPVSTSDYTAYSE